MSRLTALLPTLSGLGPKFLLTEFGQTPTCPPCASLAELADRTGSDLPEGVRIADLIEHIRVPVGHFCNHEIGGDYLFLYLGHYEARFANIVGPPA